MITYCPFDIIWQVLMEGLPKLLILLIRMLLFQWPWKPCQGPHFRYKWKCPPNC